MNVEDRLRDAMRARAAEVEPGDRLDAIGTRLDAAPSRRWRRPAFVALAAAAVIAVLVGALVIVNRDDGGRDVRTVDDAPHVDLAQPAEAIWPLKSGGTRYDTAEAAAVGFARDYLGLSSADLRNGDAAVSPVRVEVAGMVVVVEQLRGERGWWVTGSTADGVRVARPIAGETVGPGKVAVAGCAEGSGGPVRMEVRGDGVDAPLGQGESLSSSCDFAADLAGHYPAVGHGAVVAWARDRKAATVVRVSFEPRAQPLEAMWPIAATAVRFDTPAAAAESFAKDYLHIAEPGAAGTPVEVGDATQVPISRMTVHVRRLTAEAGWWVTGSEADDITVEKPEAGGSYTPDEEVAGCAGVAAVGIGLQYDGSPAFGLGGIQTQNCVYHGLPADQRPHPVAPAGAVVVAAVDDQLRPLRATVVRVRIPPSAPRLTGAELAEVAWPPTGFDRPYDTAAQAATQFALDVLGFRAVAGDPVVRRISDVKATVTVRPTDGGPETRVSTVRVDGRGWLATGADADGLVIEQPTAAGAVDVNGPATVNGCSVSAVPPTLAIRDDAPNASPLAEQALGAEPDCRVTATVTLGRRPSTRYGTVVLTLEDPLHQVVQAAAVRIAFTAGAPAATTTTTIAAGPPADALAEVSATEPEVAAERWAATVAGDEVLRVVAHRPVGELPGAMEEVDLRQPYGGPVTTVTVRRSGDQWWAVAATTPNLLVDEPASMADVATPIHVTGRSQAFEAQIVLQVVQRGQVISETAAMGGSSELQPFSTDVAVPKATPGRATLLVLTRSAKDGSVAEVTAVPITFR